MPRIFTTDTVPSADRYSDVVRLEHAAEASIQLQISNTDTVGVLYVQGSNDNTNWTNVAFTDQTGSTVASVTVSSGTDVDAMWNLSGAGFAYARVFFDYTSGGSSDTMNAVSFTKATTR